MVLNGFLQSQSNFAEGSPHSRLSQCDSRQSFMYRQNHTDRKISSSQSFSDDLPNLAQTNGRHVCNQNEQLTTSLCIFNPGSKCNGRRCIEYLVGGTRQLYLLSNSSHPKVDTKNENLSMQNGSSSLRVARDELVLGPDRSIPKNTITTTSFGKPSQATIQSKVSPKSTISQSSCLTSGLKTKLPQNSRSHRQRELRHLKDFHSEGSINQGDHF